jgi:hypothetical protein
MRKALIPACAFATIATPALAVDQAKVAVLEAQMRADEQTAIQAGIKSATWACRALWELAELGETNGYGDVTVKAMAMAMERVLRVEV